MLSIENAFEKQSQQLNLISADFKRSNAQLEKPMQD